MEGTVGAIVVEVVGTGVGITSVAVRSQLVVTDVTNGKAEWRDRESAKERVRK